jgi:exodeoxyribonuclease VII large subunit
MSEHRQIFSLKQVVSSIRKTIEERYTQLYWMKAEIYKLNRFPSGHAFPEIVQRENDKIVAQLSGTIWKQNFDRINQQFIEVVKEPLKDGSNFLMQVKITFSELYGLSLQIVDIDPSFSLGEVQRQREETLKKLQQEGILNLNQSLSFPLLPKRIAVISADSSKGLSDFMEVLDGNEQGYSYFTYLFNAYLQGDQAVDSIIQTLDKIRKVQHHFDIVVIVRGGGAEVGMTCYNHFDLCKAIATFPLPILTGIGHSTNMNVAEMISYRNAITPTKLAEFLIQTFREFDQEVEYGKYIIQSKSVELLFNANQQFDATLRLFKQLSKHSFLLTKQYLMESVSTFKQSIRNYIQKNQSELIEMQRNIQQTSKLILAEPKFELNQTTEKLKFRLNNLLLEQKRTLNEMEKNVQLLDPIHVLKRGFSITYINNKSLNSVNQIEEGDVIETVLADGKIHSVIKKN